VSGDGERRSRANANGREIAVVVRMRVGLASWRVRAGRVFMVFVLGMRVVVIEWFVSVLVLVTLPQQQRAVRGRLLVLGGAFS
jgi:hypothetical protein